MRSSRKAAPPAKRNPGELRQYFRLTTLGIEIGVSFGIGLLIGWYLDRILGTSPWLTLGFCVLGIAAGFRNIIRLARKNWDAEDEGGSDGD